MATPEANITQPYRPPTNLTREKLYGLIVSYISNSDKKTVKYCVLSHPRTRGKQLVWVPLGQVPGTEIDDLLCQRSKYNIPDLYVIPTSRTHYTTVIEKPSQPWTVEIAPEYNVLKHYCQLLSLEVPHRPAPNPQIRRLPPPQTTVPTVTPVVVPSPVSGSATVDSAESTHLSDKDSLLHSDSDTHIPDTETEQDTAFPAVKLPSRALTPPRPDLIQIPRDQRVLEDRHLEPLVDFWQGIANVMAGEAAARRDNVKTWARTISVCDGTKPDALRAWLREIDAADGVPQGELATIDLVRATVSGKLRRFIMSEAHRGQAWDVLRPAIVTDFLTGQALRATRDLRQLQQKKRSMREYTDLFIEAAELAHPDARGAPLELILARTFIDGVADATIRFQLSRDNHATLDDATTAARDLSAHAVAPDGHVNAATAMASIGDKMVSQMEALTDVFTDKLEATVAAVTRSQARAQQHPAPTGRNTSRGPQQRRPDSQACYKCGSTTHFRKDCPEARPSPAPGRCERCRRSGHEAGQCRAQVPQQPCLCGQHHWR